MPVKDPPPPKTQKFIDPPTEAEKAKVIECLKKPCHPAPYLRNFGVSFLGAPPSHDQLRQMSLPELSKYADHVIQTVAGNLALEVLTCGTEADLAKIRVSDMNETAAGAMAYLSLYGVPKRRPLYLALVQKYQAST